jgi:predicted dithiol-disulfide oxidoreductase (DUF899 family)
MSTHKTGNRQQWLDARLPLLEAEKELTRQSDALAKRRQELPWVLVDKDYRFDTPTGSVALADLFKGRSQLLVYHFMFGPDYEAGCPSCSSIADGFNGIVVHLENHDVAFTAISRAPQGKLQAFRQRMGWTFDWASSSGSDFNADFGIWFTEQQQRDGGIDYNYRREPAAQGPARGQTVSEWKEEGEASPMQQIAAMTGTDIATYARDRPGLSAFVMEDGKIYHTYSCYSRGVDGIMATYQWLDRAPKGRNEQGIWWRHHDKYAQEAA